MVVGVGWFLVGRASADAASGLGGDFSRVWTTTGIGLFVT
ncbi:Uncharacterised protein [Moraxella veridica]|nr:Uncharacterised protein [Moraxella catarrhalis]